MKNGAISGRQLMVMLWLAILPPAVELLPAAIVAGAGRAAWIPPLVVAPFFTVLGYYIYKAGGLQTGVERAFGLYVGHGVLLLYSIVGWMLLVLRLRIVAERLVGVGERNGAFWVILLAVALLAGWMAWGKRDAFGRTVEVFFAIVATTIIIVVGLSLKRVDTMNLAPIWWTDASSMFTALPTILGVLGYGIFVALFVAETEWTTVRLSRWVFWSVGGCVVLAIIQLVVLGSFGPTLVSRLDAPFFSLAKSIGIKGMFQRVEAIVEGLWLLCDLALMGVLLRGSSVVCKRLRPQWAEKVIVPSLLIPAALTALFVLPSGAVAKEWGASWGIWGCIVMGWILPITTIIMVYLRYRQKSTK